MSKHNDKKSALPSWRQKQKEESKQDRAEERKKKDVAAAAQAAAKKAEPQSAFTGAWPPPRPPTESRDQYRFLNPYNFVRYLPAPTIASNDPDAQLLGCCPPPPHDRYVGLTGRITCTLETVTPLFIADSHDVRVTKVLLASGREVEHKSYRFFQYGGKDAIPATSLRGMVRSLFEAVTNSPFGVFDADERLEYRIDPAEARRFKPGIIRTLPQDGRPGTIALCEEAKAGAYYKDTRRNVLDDSWHCGDEAYADVKRDDKGVMRVTMIVHGGTSQAAIGGMERGWVKVTGPTIDTKRNESFFYFKGDPAKARSVSFDVERENDFNAVLHAQLHERSEDFRSQVQNDRLTPGDLVYVELELSNNRQVRNIALARVARLRYRNAIGDLLPDHLKPSEHYDQFDIAARVFGWVKAIRDEDRNARVAYAGRVRLTHAVLTENGDKGVFKDELQLAILGEPKPTTTLFYLRKQKGEWTEDDRKQPGAAETVGYDGENELRGRKFYRHHGAALNRLEYERAERPGNHQNRSVRGVRMPGNVFEFAISFHNLAPVELGALLWTLNINQEGCFHRLGYAKPLGFGSVRIKVENLEFLEVDRRYQSLEESGRRTAARPEIDKLLARFESSMSRCYGLPCSQLPNIKDLIVLLREPKDALRVHIHYPRTDVRPDPEGKNFEWFVANKAKSITSSKAGPNYELKPPGDEESLQLLVKSRSDRRN